VLRFTIAVSIGLYCLKMRILPMKMRKSIWVGESVVNCCGFFGGQPAFASATGGTEALAFSWPLTRTSHDGGLSRGESAVSR